MSKFSSMQEPATMPTTVYDESLPYYISRSGINYTYLFPFEKRYFDDEFIRDRLNWLGQNWKMSLVYSAVYVCLIFAGRAYMRNRPKFDLRKPLIAWNIILATFSLVGSVRVLPELFHALSHHGYEYTVCSPDFEHGVTGCWAWLFILSKVPELFDTLFIVLRKQELIFLHWYHHCTVLIYCWYSTGDYTSSGRWFCTMNYLVHTCMYAYYACRAMHWRIPKWVSVAITTAQLSQMVVGLMVNYTSYVAKREGRACANSYSNIVVSLLMYASYFVLFFHFFYKTYFAAGGKRSITTKKAE